MPNLDDVLRMVEDGGKLDAIADLTGYPKGEIVRVARENGYALNVSSNRFQPVAPPKPKPVGVVRTQTTGAASAATADLLAAPSAAPAPVPTIRPAHRDLIDEGRASSVARVQRAAVKAEVALKTLADLLDATRAQEAARRAAEEENAKRKARIAELEQLLAAEKAALGGKRAAAATAVAAPNQAGAPTKAIRAWAAANGVDCPARGPVPQRVVDAYLAAAGEAA